MTRLFKAILSIILILSPIWLFMPWTDKLSATGIDLVSASDTAARLGVTDRSSLVMLIILILAPFVLMFMAGIISVGRPGIAKMVVSIIFCAISAGILFTWQRFFNETNTGTGIGLTIAFITAIAGIIISILVIILHCVNKSASREDNSNQFIQ